jgi:hypothetical protein
LGVQTVQESTTQAPGLHVRLLPHAPLRSHVCCVAELRHCVLPGTHTPAQAPVESEQMNGQTMPLVQFPVMSQVCGVFPTHCLALGTHMPVQLPLLEQT